VGAAQARPDVLAVLGRTAARLRAHLALAVLLVAGLALRVLLMVDYRPAVLANPDSARFLHFAHGGGRLFRDTFGPSGYAVFLKVVRAITDRFEATIALQHVFGIAAALLVYAAVRRLGAPRPAALIPAAVMLLSGDELYLEHAPLSESPFVILVAGGLYSAVRGLGDRPRTAWLALGGALLATSSLFRNVGLVLPPVLVLWTAIAMPAGWRRRAIGAAAGAAGSLAVIGIYAAFAAGTHHGTTGWADVSGWNEYGRSAPFADCKQFTPPAGTRRLCQRTSPDVRPGSLFYLWYRGSPARALFGHPPIGNSKLGEFGRAAILNQPLDYVSLVFEELPRFVDPEAGHRAFSGGGFFSIDRRNAGAERVVALSVHRDYSAAKLHVGGFVKRIAEWQRTERLGGVVPAAFVVFALAGLLFARGLAWRGTLLFGLAGGALVVLPAATLTLIHRYTIPPTPFVAAAAALGAWGVVDRLRARRSTTAPT
jgi:hypothetical protein